MNKQEEEQEEPIYSISPVGTQSWRLNGILHRMDGPAIIYPDGSKGWKIAGKLVYITPLELSVAQAIPWCGPWSDSVALVIKQINPVLYQILVGNKKRYIFSTYNYKGTTKVL